MNIYKMDKKIYWKVWDTLENKKHRTLNSLVIDRWLSFKYGLKEIPDNTYQFEVTDENKLMMFLLRWT